MASATLNLTVIPKRMLTKAEAAYHCGRPAKRFEVECPVTPVRFANGDLRWDMRDLDRWLDTLSISAPSEADDILARLD